MKQTTSIDLSNFAPIDPLISKLSVIEMLEKLDKITVKQSHTADFTGKRTRYDILDQNGFPLLKGFQRTRRLSLLPKPAAVYNNDLQTPLMENAEISSKGEVLGIVSKVYDQDIGESFRLFSRKDGLIFIVQLLPQASQHESGGTKFSITVGESETEIAMVEMKLDSYIFKVNSDAKTSPVAKSLFLGFVIYYDVICRR